LQPAMSADGDRARFAFCELEMEGTEAAEAWADEFFAYRRPQDELIDPTVLDCPECGETSFVNVGSAGSTPVGYYCFSCGEHGDYRRCEECDQPFLPNDIEVDEDDGYGEDYKCRDCWQRKFDSD
jgi:hypothetical protein